MADLLFPLLDVGLELSIPRAEVADVLSSGPSFGALAEAQGRRSLDTLPTQLLERRRLREVEGRPSGSAARIVSDNEHRRAAEPPSLSNLGERDAHVLRAI